MCISIENIYYISYCDRSFDANRGASCPRSNHILHETEI